MAEDEALLESNCPDLKLIARGKVRDIYDIDDNKLLFVTTDRISAFDVIMKNGIPGKGKILTKISMYWFNVLSDICPHHVITDDIDLMPSSVLKYKDQLAGRSMLVNKLDMISLETIIRGYITGSGWKEYQRSGTVCSIPLPQELKNCDKLPEPLFTPSTKAADGLHDENVSVEYAEEIAGKDIVDKISFLGLELYKKARDLAAERGVIIADTKFEFGLTKDKTIILGDEALTPDSSRYWPAELYEPGRQQDSFDKQFVRDYLESINFDKTNPVELPSDIVAKTYAKYIELSNILLGSAIP